MNAEMDHGEIEEGDWPERYVTGRLDPDERQRFEGHFVDCSACLDDIASAEGLKSGLQVIAASTRRDPRPRRAVRGRWLVAACAAGLLATLWGTWRQARRAEAELALERSLLVDVRNEVADARAALRRVQTERQQLEAALARERNPPAHVPVLTLIATRGADAPALELPEPPQPVVLSVEREYPPHYQQYRARLLSATGEELWQERVRPSSRDAVVLALHSSLLPPGNYLLLLEAEGPGEHWVPVGRHAFRTASSRSAH